MIPVVKPTLGREEEDAVLAVLRSGQIAQGARVEELETRFAALVGTAFAVATSSGTASLHLNLLAHGVGPGDEVITSPFTFIASANSILYTGARPVFVDINPIDFNLDPLAIEAKITDKTKALLPVHLYGNPANMPAICAIAERHGLKVVEDAAQAHAAAINGKQVGTFGAGNFSFYPTKNITAVEGGILTTSDAELAERVRRLRNHGQSERYRHESLGFNLRMSDVHAAIGLAQLNRLADYTRKRQENARYLDQGLAGAVETPKVAPGYTHVYHQYTIRIPGGRRDAVATALRERGVGSAVHYPIPVHKQPLYLDMGYRDNLPEAECAAQEVLCLPVHPSLTEQDLDTIVREVRALC
ncbi:MAG: UDP-4-amino-4-deoxy-L-arabinose--oxoglutarate aminotransferase [Chloroflexi bacterium]|nr:UDP-4-amino-4-deoxy-L-arabinose--oxoglutarate aminotransferase [Chloroflexota bacterium]